MDISKNGLEFIKLFEGFSAVPYRDVAGLKTVGFGHLIKEGEVFGAISSLEATALLHKDAQEAVDCVNDNVTRPVSQSQFDALCSFVYNIGCTSFKSSTLLRMVNDNRHDAVTGQFRRWTFAGGKASQGLLNRRIAEANLYSRSDYGRVKTT